jgi:hypothetical protein
MNNKPMGIKNYGSIPHLPNSRLGEGDHHCTEGQARIATEKKRDKYDFIIVQEKLDGSNVGIVKLNGQIIPLSRAGYRAETSPYKQHHLFADWVMQPSQYERFNKLLNESERIVGEWLIQAHGTRYNLLHEPFVGFDLMFGTERQAYTNGAYDRISNYFIVPKIIEYGNPISINEALKRIGKNGFHGAIDMVEGAVWRVERNKQINNNSSERKKIVDYLCKYVRPDKIDGLYLESKTNKEPYYNKHKISL